jgi:NAD dependent epimerase/dehydratase
MTGKVLVTGAGGFIGSTLVEELLDCGYSVRALVHYNGRGDWGHLSQLPPEKLSCVEVIAGDVTDPVMMRTVVRGCDFVCHLAALIGIPYSYLAPASYIATNVNGTLNILEACREHKVRRVVVTSTSEVYGTARYSPIDEEHPLQGQSPYSASKIAADKISESYYRCFDLPVVTLRPFNTFGPRQSSRAVIPTILTQALSGREQIELGSLDPKRDLTFVGDTARGFRMALEAPGIDGETIHFGSGETISVGELAKLCLEVVGSQAEIVCTSERLRPEKSEVGLLHCNPARANKLLGWIPTVTLKSGLKLTADYLQSRLGDHRINSYAV